jgi:hypothetical protein
MSDDNYPQTRTFKIVEKGNFAKTDFAWIGSLLNVSVVTRQKKTIRVRTEVEDAVPEIVDSITKRYCNSSKPKLSPLFCVYIQPPSKHKKYTGTVMYGHSPFHF